MRSLFQLLLLTNVQTFDTITNSFEYFDLSILTANFTTWNMDTEKINDALLRWLDSILRLKIAKVWFRYQEIK